MKNVLKFLLIALLTVGFSGISYGQDDNDDAHDITITIPEVALLDIEPAGSNSITLGPSAPTEAGDPLDFSASTNTSLWMNYSSIVGSSTEPSRDVTVAITSGTVPSGMSLTVEAAADAGNGGGNVGTPWAQVTLSSTAQTIVTGVGSCYTGDGVNNGHQLTYSLSLSAPSNYGDLDFDDATTLTVTYTLSDN